MQAADFAGWRRGRCCSSPCRPRGVPYGPADTIPSGGSRMPLRLNCAGRGYGPGSFPRWDNSGSWRTSRGSVPGSGWPISTVR